MAFDQPTRNRLQRFVNEARRVLEEEFTRQLQNDYGIDPHSASVAELSSLRHINDQQRETARILRDTLAHYCANADADTKAGLDRIVREQAFTVLNRLSALRMAEARGLLVESVGNGFQAQGFRLYARLAGTGLGETGDAYRIYLFSVFDELSQDLPGLFDRYSPQGRLFPREAALLQVLNLINDADIAPLWSEDETIGWIYQYFNSQEERKAMREARAPRNSRELAVRNQFFTPRYVVEFLVDNTLGRLWLNATGGNTHLRDRCQYLLVKPDETPQAATKLRDPRTLKLLDPACGSMHFGLYAFDLFAEIYREAWAWELQYGPGSLDISTQTQASLKPLSQTYEDEGAFLRDVPRLIIEHNLYGVDIDPRAAQIASLALWLRAQRAWHDAGVKAKDRPLIGRGHVVAAVAPPAECELRQQFAASLDQRDAKLFEKTLQLLRGLPELGVLLQVERELPQLIRQVYVGKGTGLFAQQELDDWRQAEARLREALSEFAQAAKSTYQGRLFAQDALQGLRLIDLCGEPFDVVVMNPPFGEPARDSDKYLKDSFPRSEGNILAHFIERAAQIVRDGGFVGAIVSRTCFFLQSFAHFRKTVLEQDLRLECFSDLGHGVLDAMVETAAATWSKPGGIESSATFFRELTTSNKQDGLFESINRIRTTGSSERSFTRSVSQFSVFDDRPYVYWLDRNILEKLSRFPTVEPTACAIRVGLQTGNDFRFLRLWWEVDCKGLVTPTKSKNVSDVRDLCIGMTARGKSWAWYSKTESASPFLSSIHLVANWRSNGAEIKAYHEGNGHSASKYVMSESLYFNPGISYMLRSSRLVPYIVPHGVIPTAGRSQIFPKSGKELWLTALLASNVATAAVRFRGANFWQPTLQNSMVAAVPYVGAGSDEFQSAKKIIESVRKEMAKSITRDETDPLFSSPPVVLAGNAESILNRSTILGEDFDYRVAKLFGLNHIEFGQLQVDHNEALSRGAEIELVEDEFDPETVENKVESNDAESQSCDLLSWCIGVSFGRFDWRLATGERHAPPEAGPFDPLPAKSSGMLPDGAEPFHTHSGLLADDNGHPHDLARLIEEVLVRIEITVSANVRRWLQREFFAYHLMRYSKSRRKAPIYWPLSTTSGSYTLWVYYPSLTSQTLYSAINDFIEPKLKQVSADVTALRNKGAARSRDDERQFEVLQAFELELIELRDTLLKLAPTYKPDHDDGVQITAAPLWPLFRHKPWQKVLKDTWAKLAKGDYDWAHIAMNYWPERVREKCKTDKSLAIAHGLEDLYIKPPPKPKKTRGRKAKGA